MYSYNLLFTFTYNSATHVAGTRHKACPVRDPDGQAVATDDSTPAALWVWRWADEAMLRLQTAGGFRAQTCNAEVSG